MNQSIYYILTQLSTDEASRKRFNKISHLKVEIGDTNSIDFAGYSRGLAFKYWSYSDLDGMSGLEKEKIIRTALSRIDGKAVLSGLEGDNPEYKTEMMFLTAQASEHDVALARGRVEFMPIYISEVLYETFDHPIRTGKGSDKALEALDAKMKELGIITN